MGTSLTGLTPSTTYDALIKVGDNGPLSATAKVLSDGLGNDSPLAMSTSRVGINQSNPLSARLEIVESASAEALRIDGSGSGFAFVVNGGTSYKSAIRNASIGSAYFSTTAPTDGLIVSGNVGIGTATPGNFTGVTFGDSILDVLGVVQLRGDATNGVSILQFGGTTYRKSSLYSSVGNDPGFLAVAVCPNGTDSSANEIARFTPNGLTFNGDTAAANALDDYEEGTWTMGVSFGGASTGVTYSANTGTYTKIGRQVTVNGRLALTSKGSSTGSARITGLPFNIGGAGSFYSGPTFGQLFNVSHTGFVNGFGNLSTTIINIESTSALGTLTALSDTNFANNSELMLSFTYFV